MRDVVIRPATDADAIALAAAMRASDVAEVSASSLLTPLEAVRLSMRESAHSAVALTPDGRVICIYGICSAGFLSDAGTPWMLASDMLVEYGRELLRLSRANLGAVLAMYPRLSNFVDARQVASIRWLEWLGFTIAPPAPHGPHGALFCRFSIGGRLSVQSRTVEELDAAPNLDALLAEYAAEVTIDGLPPAVANKDTYRKFGAAGMLHVLTAEIGQRLAGFLNVLVAPHPRYSVPVAVSEAFFVSKRHRKTGAGLKLLRAAEGKAREMGSSVLLVSAPAGSDLLKVLKRRGYVETNITLCKKVAHA